MKGRLNIAQRTVLVWNDLYPYNAIHVVRIPQPLDLVRLKDIITRYLEGYGLTSLAIDRRKKRFHFDGGPANIEIKATERTPDSIQTLSSEVEEQLNTPFAKNTKFNPFRFFTVNEGNSFYLGLVYFHLISGGDSIIFLLKNIVNTYLDKNAPMPLQPLNLYYRGYLPLANLKHMPAWIYSLPGHISDIRKYFRPRYPDFNNHNVGFCYFSTGPEHLRAMLKTSKKWGVTVNDMFLAILLKSLAPLSSKRIFAPRRKKISVASSVNIRKDLSIDDPGKFGMFLSSFNVSNIVPDGIQIEELVKDIRRQTKKIKKHKLYFLTVMEKWLALILISTFFKKRKNKFYSKHHPVWGGISNINLNTVWDQSDNKARIDYFRTVSTGPATPLVFSLTTVKDVLTVGVSFRTAVFSRTEVEKIISDFSEYIINLKGA